MAIGEWHGGKIVLVWLGVAAAWVVLRAVIPEYNVFIDGMNAQEEISFYGKTAELKPRLDSLRSLVDSIASLEEPNQVERILAWRAAREHDSIVTALREEKIDLGHPGYRDRQVTLAWLLVAVLPAGILTWRWLAAREVTSDEGGP